MAHRGSRSRSASTASTAQSRPRENEFAFAQRKLEENYGKVYRGLVKWRSVFDVGQEVLVWKRPVLAAFLYLTVHVLFFYFATSNESLLTQLGTLLFWLIVGDAIWRAATKDNMTTLSSSETTRPRRRAGRREVSGVVAFERAILLTHEQRSCKQFVPFEVVCVSIAQWWMWADNIWLALRHWSINDPLIFSLCLGVPGLILAVIGNYIPTIVLLYLLVMGVIVWPYIRYHELIQKASDFISAHYPVFIQNVKDWWRFLKTLTTTTNDDGVLREFSLVGGEEGASDSRTQEILGDELNIAIGQPVEGERQELREGEEGGGREGERRVNGQEMREGEEGGGRREGEMVAIHRALQRTDDPGMSVLQDSVLGMTPGGFHDVEDSMASFGPGTGDFPSISNIDDHSLTLPQFPPEDTDHSGVASGTPHLLPTVHEAEEAVAADLDPLNDSVEYEFGLDSLDTRTSSALRHRSATSHASYQPPSTRLHPLVQYSVSAPITRHLYPSLDQGKEEDDTLDRITPPPSYEAVVASQYQMGGHNIMEGAGFHSKVEVGTDQQRTVPQSSSTPLLHGYQ